MNILYKLLISPIWIKALYHIRRDQYIDALYYLNKINPKKLKNNYEYIVLRAFSYMAVGKYENAIIDCKNAFIEIEKNKKLTQSEYIYFKKYIYYILCNSYRFLNNFLEKKQCLEEFNNLKYSEIDISRRILNLFPQPEKL